MTHLECPVRLGTHSASGQQSCWVFALRYAVPLRGWGTTLSWPHRCPVLPFLWARGVGKRQVMKRCLVRPKAGLRKPTKARGSSKCNSRWCISVNLTKPRWDAANKRAVPVIQTALFTGSWCESFQFSLKGFPSIYCKMSSNVFIYPNIL